MKYGDGFDGHGFWRGSGSLSVQSLNVDRRMQEHWSVLSCIHVLDHKRSFQTLRVSTLHAQVLVLFVKLEIRGGAENLSPAGDRFLGLRRSFEREQAS